MRVSSLSDDRVIRLVSAHLVPAWLSRDRYQLPDAPREERELVAKIDADRRKKKGGAVCVYIVRADGTVLATLPVQKACKPDLLAPFLEKVIAAEKLDARPRLAAKVPYFLEKPRAKTKGGQLFAVRTRPVPAKVAEKLLRHAYPPLPHWDAKKGKLEEAKLDVTLVQRGGDGTRLSLRGSVTLIYPHLGKPTDGKVTARLVGFARADAWGRLTALMLASEEGRYVWHWEGKPQTKAMSLAIELGP
jgi:hypothetical protein